MTSDAPPVCYRHPDRTTRISCSECGKPICPDCTHDAAVGQKCPECAAPQHRTRVVNARESWGFSFRTVPITFSLVVINVAIFLLGTASPDAESWLIENLSLIKLVAPEEWWRAVTAAFLHGSFLHLGLNMYLLYLLGPQMERQVGAVAYASLYLAAAAAGGAVSALTGPLVTESGFLVTSVGASGAVFGLVGAWFSASYRHRHTPAGRAMFSQLLFFVGINALSPFLFSNIDWRAHVGGLAAGLLVHQAWMRIGPDRKNAALLRTLTCVVITAISFLAMAFL